VGTDPETERAVTTQVRFYLARRRLIADTPTAEELKLAAPKLQVTASGALLFRKHASSRFVGVESNEGSSRPWIVRVPVALGREDTQAVAFELPTEEQAALAYDAAHTLLNQSGSPPNQHLFTDENWRAKREEVEAFVAWCLRKKGLLPPREIREPRRWIWEDGPRRHRGVTQFSKESQSRWKARAVGLGTYVYLGLYPVRDEAALAVNVAHALLKLAGPTPNKVCSNAVPPERKRFVVATVVGWLRKKGLMPRADVRGNSVVCSASE
jgi:hypothetical protein